MANLSLFEVTQSQLASVPIVDGRLIVCTDTGNFYRDLSGGTRIPLGQNIEKVSALPLAPLSSKIYLLLTDQSLWYFDSTWIQLSNKRIIHTATNFASLPAVGSEACIYIVKNQNKTYRWDDVASQYFCIGSDYNDIGIIDGGTA